MAAHLAHFAINTDDIDRSRSFYEKVFGWKVTAWGPPGFYQILWRVPNETSVRTSWVGLTSHSYHSSV